MLRNVASEENTFNQRLDAVLSSIELTFEESVREYRNIEAEFVERAGDNEYQVVEIRRHITGRLLGHANIDEQSHEICRAIWHELLQRGFSDSTFRYTMSGLYARCCEMNGEFDVGLAIIEPIIAEYEQALADPMLSPNRRAYYKFRLDLDRAIQAELKAGFRGAQHEEGLRTRPKAKPDDIAFNQQISAILLSDKHFEEAAREYRRIEAEFIERAHDNERHVLEAKRRIAELLLVHARMDKQPHEVCREIWRELMRRGFSSLEDRFHLSGTYARCCQMNGEFNAGLAVIEPLIAEAEQALADPALKQDLHDLFVDELKIHHTIRDELKAGIRAVVPIRRPRRESA